MKSCDLLFVVVYLSCNTSLSSPKHRKLLVKAQNREEIGLQAFYEFEVISNSDNIQSCLDVYVERCMSKAGLKGNILVVNIFYDLGVGTVSIGM